VLEARRSEVPQRPWRVEDAEALQRWADEVASG